MSARLVDHGPRVVALAAALVALSTATLTLAATKAQLASKKPAAAPAAAQAELVVPDVRRQAYVFAKAALEESGFAWKISGSVQGYAANTVVTQSPLPGTKVVDNGQPVITLTLARNPEYKQEGTPENAAPYTGHPLKVVGAPAVSQPKPVAKPAPKAAPKPAAKAPAPKPAAKAQDRPPAFEVPGAPKEPLKEAPLPERAKQLAAWLEKHPKPTTEAVNHWLYQHSWIVTGAELGWWRGAEALKTLVEVDRRVQQLWGVGAKSEQLARQALARVEAKSK